LAVPVPVSEWSGFSLSGQGLPLGGYVMYCVLYSRIGKGRTGASVGEPLKMARVLTR